MKQTFVNCSNHRTENWSQAQLEAAGQYGEVVDLQFPPVPADASLEEVRQMAAATVEKILTYAPAAVMCQGEFTLTYHIVSMLKEEGVTVVAACSERKVQEVFKENGVVEKLAVFDFVQFREF